MENFIIVIVSIIALIGGVTKFFPNFQHTKDKADEMDNSDDEMDNSDDMFKKLDDLLTSPGYAHLAGNIHHHDYLERPDEQHNAWRDYSPWCDDNSFRRFDEH